MEYLIIIACELLGIGFQVMQKVSALKQQHKEFKKKEIFKVFWDEDWNTLAISGLIFLANLLGHYIVANYSNLEEGEWYFPISFGIAITLGYGGQTIVYKYLGTAQQALQDKADKIKQI